MASDQQLLITSTAFAEGTAIPKKHTCDGEDVNPMLHIDGIPDNTKSLALIMDDPDAPHGTFVHWVAWNIPVRTDLPENSVPGQQGMNDFRKTDYGGPCPPSGTHRYFFKIYALDRELDLPSSTTKAQLLNAIEGHVLASGTLMGTYERK